MTRLQNTLITLAAAGILVGSPGASLAASQGTTQTLVTVTMIRESCDYFIVETEAGFCIFEWFGGNMPIKGDILRGDLDSYGFQNAYNVTQKADITAYVEEYWLDQAEVMEMFYKLCGVETGNSAAD